MIRICLPLLALAATGCIPAPEQAATTPPPPVAEGGKCDAAPVQRLVGTKLTSEVTGAIVRDSGSRNARVIRPGMMVTMDYREDRVNVRIDAQGRITQIDCG